MKVDRFVCTGCGVCCRKIVITNDYGTFGLYLEPQETKLFPKWHVEPFWGFGVKGRRRNRPKFVGAYQFTGEQCPYVTKQNECRIYERRPLVCRAYPLSLFFIRDKEGKVHAEMDNRCPVINKRFPEEQIELPHGGLDYLGETAISADLKSTRHFENCVLKSDGYLWLYHFKQQKWQLRAHPSKKVN